MQTEDTAVFRQPRLFPGFLAVTFLLGVGIATLRFIDALGGDGEFFGFVNIAIALGIAGFFAYELLRAPRRIEASSSGLRFVAVTRVVDVPWPALESVTPSRFDRSGQTFVWRWDGRRLRTTNFYGFHGLLRLVEGRAPQAEVRER